MRISAASAPRIKADVVGPVCETGDYLALDREMAMPKPAIFSRSARRAPTVPYRREPITAACWCPRCSSTAIVPRDRPRRGYDELIGLDSVPDWLD